MSDFVVGKNGLFKRFKNGLFEGILEVRNDPLGQEIKEGFRPRFNKMPRSLFDRACAFIRWCKEAHGSEGMVAFIQKGDQWDLACPDQWNSAAGICYHPELHGNEFLGWVGDIHGHPGSSSCHSGIDHGDESTKGDGVFVVVGVPFDVEHATVTGMFMRRQLRLDIGDLVDLSSPPGDGSFPEVWKERFHKAPCEICVKSHEHEHPLPDNWELEPEAEELMQLANMAADLFRVDRAYGQDADIFRCDACGQASSDVSCTHCHKPLDPVRVFRAVGSTMAQVVLLNDIMQQRPGEK